MLLIPDAASSFSCLFGPDGDAHASVPHQRRPGGLDAAWIRLGPDPPVGQVGTLLNIKPSQPGRRDQLDTPKGASHVRRRLLVKARRDDPMQAANRCRLVTRGLAPARPAALPRGHNTDTAPGRYTRARHPVISGPAPSDPSCCVASEPHRSHCYRIQGLRLIADRAHTGRHVGHVPPRVPRSASLARPTRRPTCSPSPMAWAGTDDHVPWLTPTAAAVASLAWHSKTQPRALAEPLPALGICTATELTRVKVRRSWC